jgi:general secretion pathway protein F
MPSPKQQAHLYRNLHTMLKAGIGILRALEMAGRNSPGRGARACREMPRKIAQGRDLAQAMSESPRAFPAIDVQLVQAGEMSGRLSETFLELSRWYDLRQKIRTNLVNGLLLPGLILHAAALVAPLPAFVLGQADLTGYILSGLALLAVFYVPLLLVLAVVYLTPATGGARALLDYVASGIPVLGRGLAQWAYARTFRVLSMLLSAGVPIARASRIASDLCPNAKIRRQFASAARSVESGASFSTGLGPSMLREYRESLVIAEETGTLQESLDRLAELAEQAAERSMTQLSVWLPRLVYLLILLLLAWQVISNALLLLEKAGLSELHD